MLDESRTVKVNGSKVKVTTYELSLLLEQMTKANVRAEQRSK